MSTFWCPYGVHNNAKMGKNDGKYFGVGTNLNYEQKWGLACVFRHLPNPLRMVPETDAASKIKTDLTN